MTAAAVSTTTPPFYRIYGDYAGDGPVFYEVDDFPWVETLRRNWEVIRDEVEDYRARHGRRLQPVFVPDLVELAGWTSVNLFTCSLRYPRNCAQLPKTVKILEGIPGLVSAFVNLLEAHSRLPAHCGDSDSFYRCHLALKVPKDGARCGMDVAGRRTTWREGEAFVFNDAHKHFVWNDSDEERLVLVVDVARPQFGATPRICSRALGTMPVAFLQLRSGLFRRLPEQVVRGVHLAVSYGLELGLLGLGLVGLRLRSAPETPR